MVSGASLPGPTRRPVIATPARGEMTLTRQTFL